MNKVIFLTGASKGIGKAIAMRLGKNNKLTLFSRSLPELKEIEKSINELNKDVLVLQGDVTKEQDVKDAINKTIEKWGTLDVVINNAGVGIFKRVDKFSLEEFKLVQEVNMVGCFLVTKYATPTLINKKQGQIINIASVAGLNGFKYGSAYAASKFAMVGFTESIREDLKGFGIAVTAVCPGGVRTGFGGNDPEKMDRDFLMEADDVARTVEYLISESETVNTKLIELKPRKHPNKR